MDEQVAGYRIVRHDKGAVFWLARPEKLNSITSSILTGLSDCIDELERRSARWLVIAGEGARAFCAGSDLAEGAAVAPDAVDVKTTLARRLFFRLANSPVVSVAAIGGIAYGGGLELAMACTFRVATAEARFSLPEVKLGVFPGYGGTQFLPALVGPARALDLMLTGRSVDAVEALAMGLISRIADAQPPLLEQALALASQVTDHSREAVAGIRRCVAVAGPMVTEEGLAVEQAELRGLMNSEDVREGIRAFLERRAPK